MNAPCSSWWRVAAHALAALSSTSVAKPNPRVPLTTVTTARETLEVRAEVRVSCRPSPEPTKNLRATRRPPPYQRPTPGGGTAGAAPPYAAAGACGGGTAAAARSSASSRRARASDAARPRGRRRRRAAWAAAQSCPPLRPPRSSDPSPRPARGLGLVGRRRRHAATGRGSSRRRPEVRQRPSAVRHRRFVSRLAAGSSAAAGAGAGGAAAAAACSASSRAASSRAASRAPPPPAPPAPGGARPPFPLGPPLLLLLTPRLAVPSACFFFESVPLAPGSRKLSPTAAASALDTAARRLSFLGRGAAAPVVGASEDGGLEPREAVRQGLHVIRREGIEPVLAHGRLQRRRRLGPGRAAPAAASASRRARGF